MAFFRVFSRSILIRSVAFIIYYHLSRGKTFNVNATLKVPQIIFNKYNNIVINNTYFFSVYAKESWQREKKWCVFATCTRAPQQSFRLPCTAQHTSNGHHINVNFMCSLLVFLSVCTFLCIKLQQFSPALGVSGLVRFFALSLECYTMAFGQIVMYGRQFELYIMDKSIMVSIIFLLSCCCIVWIDIAVLILFIHRLAG